ncbi:MAG: hypothetical protein CR991_02570 [Proteobacteria bacterium]|nr:MAG: hypothetical protein CR991_02570 [Pseudomonadota bacterium]
MFGNDRESLRHFYQQTWQKHQQKQSLNSLEQQVALVIKEHPEYHRALLNKAALGRDYSVEAGEANPFLHLSLHLGLREQIKTDRPSGIQAIYYDLSSRMEPHDAEHQMIECLAESLWLAQRNGSPPDEATYLSCLTALLMQ